MSLKFLPDAIETWPLDRLRPYAQNARTHSSDQVARIAGSLVEYGWTNPVMVADDGEIVAGHGRLLAAQYLGLSEVPVIRLSHLTPAQVRAYRIADNRFAELAGWDDELLAAELHALNAEGFDLDLTGFDGAELDRLLAPLDEDGAVDGDVIPEPPASPVSRPGDLWLLGDHRLLCGDSTSADDVARLLDGGMVDLVVTSPPYNQKINTFCPSGMHREADWVGKVGRLAYFDDMPENEYQDQQRLLLGILFNNMRDHGSVFYNHKNRYRDKSVVSPLSWIPGPFTLRQEIIWRRPGSVTQNARMFLPCDERIYWMYNGDDFVFDDSTDVKTWSSVWDISPETNKDHAVAFPKEIPSRCIRACSKRSDTVLDPYSGSGTTMVVCHDMSRVFRGMEISPVYVDVAVKRWEAATGRKALLDGDGRAFEVVAAERL